MTLEAGDDKYLFMTVEYRPRDEVLDWANRVLEDYSDFKVVLVTHSYMWTNGFLTTSGNEIWNDLRKKHENVRLVLCGHAPGRGMEVAYGEGGNKVVQLLSDYQYYSNGGHGLLRIMTFYPGDNRVRVQTYSPFLDTYMDDPKDHFSFKLP